MNFSRPRLLRPAQTTKSCLDFVRHYSIPSASRRELVTIPCRSNGHITLSLFHPLVASSATSSIILYLPPGPLLPTSLPTIDVGAALSSVTSATVVQINYRCSKEHQYPTPIHDVLTGYDWVLENLVPDRSGYTLGREFTNQRVKLAVCGELVGGSLAAMLTLTECRAQGPYVAAAAINEPVVDWVFPEDGEIERESVHDRFASFAEELATGRKSRSKPKPRPTSFSTCSGGGILTASMLLNARSSLFRRPEDYFDTFASPLFNFRTPGVAVPSPHSKPIADDFAELEQFEREDFHRQQLKLSSLTHQLQNPESQQEEPPGPTKKPRRSRRKWPNAGSSVRIPQMRISSAVTSPLSDQVSEFAGSIQKSIVSQELRTVEAEEDDMAEEAAYMLAERQIYHRQPDDLRLWSLGQTHDLRHVAHWCEQVIA